jgi:hypothetical protein
MTTKTLEVKYLKSLQDFVHDRYCVLLPAGYVFADLFVPTFWAHHASRLKVHDMVRVVSQNIASPDAFDVDLTVAKKLDDGLVMKVRPLFMGLSSEAALSEALKVSEDVRLKTVPFDDVGRPVARVEYLPATKWRALGLNGVIASGLENEADAQRALTKYLADAKMAMPTADEITAAEVAAKAKADAARAASEAKRKSKAA